MAYKNDIDDLRESPALTIIELLQKDGAQVSYNDPYFPFIGKGPHYDLQMKCTPVEDVNKYDCVLIVTDHSDYDYEWIAQHDISSPNSRAKVLIFRAAEEWAIAGECWKRGRGGLIAPQCGAADDWSVSSNNFVPERIILQWG